MERARKIEDSEMKLNELELLRCKYNRKVGFLKDQLKSYRDTTTQERDLNDHAFQQLSQELNATKKNLMEASRREAQVVNLLCKKRRNCTRNNVCVSSICKFDIGLYIFLSLF